jgi:predicted ribosome quality control (RQC) complex YloA/Tae2 family protein
MKNEMTAFDVLAVVKEITPLVGGYLDKVFHWESRNLLLRVNVPNLGRREIVLLDLKWLYVSSERPETPEFPSQFAVHMRKLLSNARIEGVSQQEFDRVVVIDLLKEKGYKLVIELFGEGNLLLVSEGKIVNCLISKTWKSREVRPGAEYQFPPARFNPRTQGFEAFKNTFLSSNSDVVRTLATSINLGGQYAEEVCLRASVEKKTKASKADEATVERLHSGLKSILDELPTAQATAVLEGENAIDVTPLALQIHQDLGGQHFPSFSLALQFFLEHRKVAEKVALGNPEVQKLERQLQQQRDTAERGGEESERLTRAAEALYTAYNEYASMLSTIKKNAGKTDWEELRRFASALPSVESIDPQKKKVRVRLADVVADLDYTTSLDDNANLLYSKAKEAREKQNRSLDLVRATEARIADLRAKDTKAALVEKTTVKKTKEFWFEAYKWFITSGGHLVVAGRDVRTNDQVVKKHLKLPDRYAHADVHGAPSVVIKDGSTASDQELREACIFALAHSKAWNAGVQEGSAYWVLPDQVSKTPEAGAFVPRGAFIIRGKRNYEHHISLELAIGEIEHEGARKIMCAPRTSMESRSKRYLLLAPGEMARSKLSSSLAKELGVPEEEVSRILPPGDVKILESHGLALGQPVGKE